MPKKSKRSGKERDENSDDQQASVAIVCAACAKAEPPDGTPFSMCTACKKVYYCDVDCQRWHWRKGGHKQECAKLQESARRRKESTGAKTPARTEQPDDTCTTPSTVTPTKPDAIHAVCIGEDGYHMNIQLSPLEFQELERDGLVPPLPRKLGNDIFISKPNHSEDIAILMMDPTTGETPSYWKGAQATCVVAYSDGSPFSTDNLEHLVQMLREFRDRGLLHSIPPRVTTPFASQLGTNDENQTDEKSISTMKQDEVPQKSNTVRAVMVKYDGKLCEVELSRQQFERLLRRGTVPLLPQKLGVDIVMSNLNDSQDVRFFMTDPKSGETLSYRNGSDGEYCTFASLDGRPYTKYDHFCLTSYIAYLHTMWSEERVKPPSWDLSPRGLQEMLRSEGFKERRRANKLETVLAPRVLLFGLQSQSELNGQQGFRGKWIEKDGRFQVFLDNDDDKKIRLIKPSNIHVFPSK